MRVGRDARGDGDYGGEWPDLRWVHGCSLLHSGRSRCGCAMPERACAMLDPVATVRKGGRAWSPVCAKPDPVGKSAISGVCHAGSGGRGGEGGRARSLVGGEGGPRWGREFAERAAARLKEHGERALHDGSLTATYGWLLKRPSATYGWSLKTFSDP
jgi:hypothetical protein